MADINWVSGDVGNVAAYILKDDGVGRDLTTATAIECHMRNSDTGTVITIGSLTGTAGGSVSTTFGTLTTGTFTLEWEVTEGVAVKTYPGDGDTRPVVDVRDQAA